MAAFHGLIDHIGIVNDLVKVLGKVCRRREGIALYLLKAERKRLADVFNFMEADEITEI